METESKLVTKRKKQKTEHNYGPEGKENSPSSVPEDIDNLPEGFDDEEPDRELDMKAEKNNLTARNVKNMIKAVVTDNEVLKMVNYSLHKTVEKPVYEPKLTRSKTKELVGLEQNSLWNIHVTPRKSDIEALITQELPEDSSDEEYDPQEEISDEESKFSESGLAEEEGSELDISIRSVASVDSSIVNENIGQRTRSKLSLSETPLEAIELAFVPPDITTDMYNTHCDNIEWLNFLKEFTQPLDSNQQEEINDDENDPEYNVMVDEEHEATDNEELRHDRAVKVTKKEYNELMSELFEYTDLLSSEDEEVHEKVEEGKPRFVENKRCDINPETTNPDHMQNTEYIYQPEGKENLLSVTGDIDNIPEMFDDEELDRELDMKAEKNNLTARNVKKMIKAVVTDNEVLKMVNYSLQKTTEKPVYEPKLTRAKTKELIGLEQNTLWNIPVAPRKSDIEALITQELPEDSSDEEYDPREELSDEESKFSESGLVEEEGSELDMSIRSVASVDSSVVNENIGQRTRSKLSLSETPLEAIELAFAPPDITTDMYNTHCDNIEWLNFLTEFTQPLNSNQQEEINDDENDPEYNVMIDEEHEATDKEELRDDRAVKVTKKEYNELMSELFEYTALLSSEDEEVHSKVNEGKNGVVKNKRCDSRPVKTNSECRVQFSDFQCSILKQQLQQHVQLLLQRFLLTFGNAGIDESFSSESISRLQELESLSKVNPNSFFNILNLHSSLDLINKWTAFINNCENTRTFLLEELNKVNTSKKKRVNYLPALPEPLIKMCLKSDAFLYPLLLPANGFSHFDTSRRSLISPYEDLLLAIGLEEFSTYFDCDLKNSHELTNIIAQVHHYLAPAKKLYHLINHIKSVLKSSTPNPIKTLLEIGKAPDIQHYVSCQNKLTVLSEKNRDFVPDSWKKYLEENTSNRWRLLGCES